MNRTPAVVAGLLLVALEAAVPGASLGQEARTELPLPGGGSGVRLDLGDGHSVTVRRADGGLLLSCTRGDQHVAMAELERVLDEAETDAAAWATRAKDGAAAGIDGTIAFEPRRRAGTDADGWPLLYTPVILTPGSTRSHFDTSAFPNLLMEPFISSDLPLRGVDLASATLADLGWRRAGGMPFELLVADPEGEGFLDPVLGPERLRALRAAVRIWGRHLGTRTPLRVEAAFAPLPCQGGSAVLAGAAPTFAFRDFPGGDRRTWYPGPIAESITGEDLTGADEPDLFILFNSALDEGCLGAGTGWYYGTSGSASDTQIAFLTVALHELGHGLGFTGFADLETGRLFLGLPDVYTKAMHDNRLGQTWDEMGNARRRQSAVRDGEVVLTAPRTRRQARGTLGGSTVLTLDGPDSVAGSHRVGVAAFGPEVGAAGISGELVLVDDGSDSPRTACQALANAAEVAGKIAVVARGDCTFTTKVASAQAAGAIAVVVANNVAGAPLDMGGVDDTITIPSVMVSRRVGSAIREVLR